jgi:hypothetical protein
LTQRSATAFVRGDYSEAPQAVIEGHAVAVVAIVNEKSRWPPIPGTAFDNLFGRPFGRRVACHADVQDFSIGVPNDEEDIERLEQNRLNAEKIAGSYVRCVIL